MPQAASARPVLAKLDCQESHMADDKTKVGGQDRKKRINLNEDY